MPFRLNRESTRSRISSRSDETLEFYVAPALYMNESRELLAILQTNEQQKITRCSKVRFKYGLQSEVDFPT